MLTQTIFFSKNNKSLHLYYCWPLLPIQNLSLLYLLQLPFYDGTRSKYSPHTHLPHIPGTSCLHITNTHSTIYVTETDLCLHPLVPRQPTLVASFTGLHNGLCEQGCFIAHTSMWTIIFQNRHMIDCHNVGLSLKVSWTVCWIWLPIS